jgi:aryl-alcohol dehydrogenase-like predicted oxidoreductase
MTDNQARTEEFQVQGEQIISKIKELVREGNIRHISIRNEEGETLVDIPLTLGVVGALFLPQLAALGAIAALVSHCTIVIEKTDEGA